MYFVKLNDSSIPLQYADKAKGLFYAEDETMTTLANLCKKNGVELGITEDKRATADSSGGGPIFFPIGSIVPQATDRCDRPMPRWTD